MSNSADKDQHSFMHKRQGISQDSVVEYSEQPSVLEQDLIKEFELTGKECISPIKHKSEKMSKYNSMINSQQLDILAVQKQLSRNNSQSSQVPNYIDQYIDSQIQYLTMSPETKQLFDIQKPDIKQKFIEERIEDKLDIYQFATEDSINNTPQRQRKRKNNTQAWSEKSQKKNKIQLQQLEEKDNEYYINGNGDNNSAQKTKRKKNCTFQDNDLAKILQRTQKKDAGGNRKVNCKSSQNLQQQYQQNKSKPSQFQKSRNKTNKFVNNSEKVHDCCNDDNSSFMNQKNVNNNINNKGRNVYLDSNVFMLQSNNNLNNENNNINKQKKQPQQQKIQKIDQALQQLPKQNYQFIAPPKFFNDKIVQEYKDVEQQKLQRLQSCIHEKEKQEELNQYIKAKLQKQKSQDNFMQTSIQNKLQQQNTNDSFDDIEKVKSTDFIPSFLLNKVISQQQQMDNVDFVREKKISNLSSIPVNKNNNQQVIDNSFEEYSPVQIIYKRTSSKKQLQKKQPKQQQNQGNQFSQQQQKQKVKKTKTVSIDKKFYSNKNKEQQKDNDNNNLEDLKIFRKNTNAMDESLKLNSRKMSQNLEKPQQQQKNKKKQENQTQQQNFQAKKIHLKLSPKKKILHKPSYQQVREKQKRMSLLVNQQIDSEQMKMIQQLTERQKETSKNRLQKNKVQQSQSDQKIVQKIFNHHHHHDNSPKQVSIYNIPYCIQQVQTPKLFFDIGIINNNTEQNQNMNENQKDITWNLSPASKQYQSTQSINNMDSTLEKLNNRISSQQKYKKSEQPQQQFSNSNENKVSSQQGKSNTLFNRTEVMQVQDFELSSQEYIENSVELNGDYSIKEQDTIKKDVQIEQNIEEKQEKQNDKQIEELKQNSGLSNLKLSQDHPEQFEKEQKQQLQIGIQENKEDNKLQLQSVNNNDNIEKQNNQLQQELHSSEQEHKQYTLGSSQSTSYNMMNSERPQQVGVAFNINNNTQKLQYQQQKLDQQKVKNEFDKSISFRSLKNYPKQTDAIQQNNELKVQSSRDGVKQFIAKMFDQNQRVNQQMQENCKQQEDIILKLVQEKQLQL